MFVKNLMSRDIVTCSPTDYIQEIAHNMRTLDIGSMPVVDRSQRVVGIITDHDISNRTDLTSQTKVDEVMTKNIVTVTPGTSAHEAAALLAAYNIRRLPVVEEGLLVGYLTLSELSVPDPISSRTTVHKEIAKPR